MKKHGPKFVSASVGTTLRGSLLAIATDDIGRVFLLRDPDHYRRRWQPLPPHPDLVSPLGDTDGAAKP